MSTNKAGEPLMTQYPQLSTVRKSRISAPIPMGTRRNAHLKTGAPYRTVSGIIKGTKQARHAAGITGADQERDNRDPVDAVSANQVDERTAAAEKRAGRLQALAVELIEAEERERQRIAHLLHEDLQQIIAAARFQLQWACEKLHPEPMLENVLKLLEETIGKSRRLSHALSPPVLHCLGLVAGLKWLAREMQENYAMQIQLTVNATGQLSDIPLSVFLFRATQELLFNTFKHAGVRSARVNLSNSPNGLVLTVSDHGRGFDPAIIDSSTDKIGLGLMSIRERAVYSGCDFRIESAPGQGSRCILTVPPGLANGQDEAPRAEHAQDTPYCQTGAPEPA
jgi:signal transduction histidine kinase